MISVLIPTYNYKCYTLVQSLQQQLEHTNKEYEIIVAEDGGKDQVTAISNHRINDLPCCRYIRRQENVGRAAIRNFLVAEAKGDWCIIIDSDAKVVKDNYIRTYLDYCRTYPEIDFFLGDLVNPEKLPSTEATLRYIYEKKIEPSRSVENRSKKPFMKFSTFNFMARRTALLEIPFDETCTEYGYEDTLMGIEMQKHGKSIMHIDNPLMHMGFDSNKVYLSKVEASLRTLKKISHKLIDCTRIGIAAATVQKYRYAWLIKFCFFVSKPLLRRNLLSHNPSIKILNFYKLGYYLSLKS